MTAMTVSHKGKHFQEEEIPYDRNKINFSDQRARAFIDEWISDVADLESKSDNARLQFPSWSPGPEQPI